MPANSRAHKQQKRAPIKAPMKRAVAAEKGSGTPAKKPERKHKLRSQ